jgi:hypothetical protein
MAGSSREAELIARLAALEERLAEVEAAAAEADARARDAEMRASAGPMEAVDMLLGMVLPAEVRSHMRAARKEQLLAVRSLVDSWIERVDRAPSEPRRRHRKESIPLEDA